MTVAVVGLGKIGLPLAVQYAAAGRSVIGADLDPARVALINEGQEPFPGEQGLSGRLAGVVGSGRLRATTDVTQAASEAETIVVVVPLVVDGLGHPDFAALDAATAAIAAGITPGTLVCYETTLPVGTTRHRWHPMLQHHSGLGPDDLEVVFSPERVLTGRVFRDLGRYPKIIGALTAKGAQLARAFYASVLDFETRADLSRPNGVWDLGSAEAAELTKLAETTYRDVNIGLANQFAIFASTQQIDIYAVIEAANSQPYSHIHQPGIAVGGHCIPVYPQLYLAGDPDASIVASARQANAAMPAYAIDLAVSAYGDLSGATAVVLGAAYRGGVRETAFSGVFPLVAELRSRGATVRVHDPLYSDEELSELGFAAYHPGEPLDVAFVQADHGEYRSYGAEELPGVQVVVDGRRIVDADLLPEAAVLVIGGPTRCHQRSTESVP